MNFDPKEAFNLSGRVAIITGGAGLLGAVHCRTLANAGAHIVIADLAHEKAVHVVEAIAGTGGPDALALKTDVADPESVGRMVNETLHRFGRVDILVNNAALDPKFDAEHAGEHSQRFEDLPLQEWQRVLEVNVTGMFLCAQAVARPMLEADRGVIVNISSTYGLVGPDQRIYQRPDQPEQFKPVTYSVSKAAALGLTRYLAAYFTNTGIRVNALTPGGVFADHEEEFVRNYSAKAILGRMAEREEISMALLFLVSDASSYMTGANLVVDGGWTAW